MQTAVAFYHNYLDVHSQPILAKVNKTFHKVSNKSPVCPRKIVSAFVVQFQVFTAHKSAIGGTCIENLEKI